MMPDGHYSHADRGSLEPIPWAGEPEVQEFKTFALQYLGANGPTHLSHLITTFFRTEYLSPVYMGRLLPVALVLMDLHKVGAVIMDENEHLPVRLPNQMFPPEAAQ